MTVCRAANTLAAIREQETGRDDRAQPLKQVLYQMVFGIALMLCQHHWGDNPSAN